MKIISLSLLISFFILSCQNSTGKANDNKTKKGYIPNGGKLYLRTFMMSGSLEITWIYLGDDGTIVYNPTAGVNPVNYVSERANHNPTIGKYKLNGNELKITWDGGTASNQAIEYRDGEISIINGGIITRQTGVPAGFTLNGQYAGGAITKNLAVTNTYVFSGNGTFILKRKGTVNLKTQEGTLPDHGATSKDELPGSYTITGNTLTLRFDDGTKETAVIGIMNMKGGIRYLIINQSSFRMER